MSLVYVAVLVLDKALVAVSDVVGAGITAVVGSDVAVAMGGFEGENGGWWMSWEQRGGVGQLLARRSGFWGRQSRSVECMTCSDEHARTTSRNSVSWAVNSVGASFTAWLMFSKERVAVWALDITQVLVLGVGVAGVVPVVDCDVVVAVGGSGCETRGCRVCRGAVGRLGSVCRRS